MISSKKVGIILVVLSALGWVYFIWTVAPAAIEAGQCAKSGCSSSRMSGSQYCYTHDPFRAGAELYERNHRNNTYTYTQRSTNSNTSNYNNSGNSGQSSYSNSSSTKRNFDSYNEGYDNIYMDDDFDMDRYYSDSDYASGVDDAMDDLDWDY